MTLVARLELWLPPLLLMAVIFFFSAQPDLDSGLGDDRPVGRKVVHFAAVRAALRTSGGGRSSTGWAGRRAALAALRR